jgi:CheY-like chemotaxis protein
MSSTPPPRVERTVLLVDDDPRNVFALSSVLERRGMRVLTANNGSEAIKCIESDAEVAIVPMDIMMPEMDGYQTIQRSARAVRSAGCRSSRLLPRR